MIIIDDMLNAIIKLMSIDTVNKGEHFIRLYYGVQYTFPENMF